jgi:exodeoxyribonuclease III
MTQLKLATWNVNSLRVRLPHVMQWLATNQPDVLALQETKLVDEDFPAEVLQAAGYYVQYAGQKTYNGVALLSKHPIENVQIQLNDFDDPQRRVIAATIAGVRIVNCYVPNGESLESEKYQYKLQWLAQLHRELARQSQQYSALVVVGDFNIAPEDRDVHDPVYWHDRVLVSAPERQALQKLLALGFDDVFRQFDQTIRFSWWDYRAAAFRRNLGLRIDLVLTSKQLTSSCQACYVDKVPRGWERPSDHAPVVAEFEK